MKSEVVMIENDKSFNNAHSNVKAQDNLKTSDDTVSVENLKLFVFDDSSTASLNMQKLFMLLNHIILTNFDDSILTSQMIINHVNWIKCAAETDLNFKNVTVTADFIQYTSVNLEEIFFSMKSDTFTSKLSDSMQVCIMWKINFNFHSLSLKQIVMYKNMHKLTVTVKSETSTMIVQVRIVLFNISF